MAAALAEHRVELNELLEEEVDPALGNGGRGRLAACYGCDGDGRPAGDGARPQLTACFVSRCGRTAHEAPDDWQRDRYPWFRHNAALDVPVGLGGKVKSATTARRMASGTAADRRAGSAGNRLSQRHHAAAAPGRATSAQPFDPDAV